MAPRRKQQPSSSSEEDIDTAGSDSESDVQMNKSPDSDSELDVQMNKSPDSESEDGKVSSKEVVKRHVMTPIERIDIVIKKMEDTGQPNTKDIVNQMMKLRKQLDGAKIKPATTNRLPNAYNLWMKENMALLKGNDMNPKERFTECIRLWNENKQPKPTPACQ
jgi:hypothetical protein